MTTPLSILLLSAATLNASPAPVSNPLPQSVLLDFTASWCGPCQQMNPLVSALQRQGYPIRKVDVDKERELAQRFGISSIPAFVLVVNGKEVHRSVGMKSERELKQLMAQIPRATPPQIAATAQPKPVTFQPQKPKQPKLDSRPDPTRIPAQLSAPASTPASVAHEVAVNEPAARPVPRTAPVRQPADAAVATAPVIRAQHTAPEHAPADATRTNPLASSTRIRVKDGSGINFGSGTMIDSRPGRTTILTCGHIFRGLSDNATIEVDVFDGDRHETYVGKVLEYDLEADVGLIGIPTVSTLAVSRLAGAECQLAKGDAVYSIGCGGGEPPMRLQSQVTALNRYLGPENVECTGVPVQGRSGGGLFNAAGQVVGVCVAADPRDQRGLYAGPKAVYSLLERAQLAHLYKPQAPTALAERDAGPGRHEPAPVGLEGAPGADDRDFIALAESDTLNPADFVQIADETRGEGERRPAPGHSSPFEDEAEIDAAFQSLQPTSQRNDSRSTPAGLARQEPADAADEDLESIRSAIGRPGEAEVVCIIRPLNNPQSASRVVIINRASSKFVSYLVGEVKDQVQPTMQTVKFADPTRALEAAQSPATSISTAAVDSRGATPTSGAQHYRRSADSRLAPPETMSISAR